MPALLLAMTGGAIGAGLRFEVGRVALRMIGPGLPWATFAINLAGGLLMGLLAGLLSRMGSGAEPVRVLLGVGVLGGFTTFSAFSLEAWGMIERGQTALAAGYAIASVVGSVALLALGLTIARGIA